MPGDILIRNLLLPELSLIRVIRRRRTRTIEVHVQKQPKQEYCPRCATVASSAYDHRMVRVKDEPLRG